MDSVTTPPLPAADRGEVVIGLVKAIGADLGRVVPELESQLRAYRWHVETISLFEASEEANREAYARFAPSADGYTAFPFDYWREHRAGMDLGDWARDFTRLPDIIVRDAIQAIANRRQHTNQVFVLRSLMHDSEINLLKDVYGKRFFAIAAYAPRPSRKAWLAHKMAVDDAAEPESALKAADDLIEQEGHGSGRTLNIEKTFQRADIFVDVTRAAATTKAIERFVAYLFGYPFGTPTIDEFGMSIAWQARYASDALSRSVGAAAVDGLSGRLLAAASNGTPRPPMHGPWPDDVIYRTKRDTSIDGDYREHVRGHDSSDRKRWDVFEDTMKRLLDEGLLRDDVNLRDLYANSSRIRGMKQFDSISYGSTIHAEANLIATAASSRTSLRGATLYVTTYPCHECTRLIIRSGVQRVVFIEPYPKSLAADLYDRQISERDSSDEHKTRRKITFEPFVGIAPTRFTDLFSFEPRKAVDSGESALRNLGGAKAKWPTRPSRIRKSILPPLLLTPEATKATMLLEQVCIRAAKEAWAQGWKEADVLQFGPED